jgi:hypothetical protein
MLGRVPSARKSCSIPVMAMKRSSQPLDDDDEEEEEEEEEEKEKEEKEEGV